MSYKYGPSIVTDGLVFYVDAANSKSYPGTGTTWSDLIGSNDGTLTNGPTYDSGNGGSVVLDGTNDYVALSEGGLSFPNDSADFTFEIVIKFDTLPTQQNIFQQEDSSGTGRTWIFLRDDGSGTSKTFGSFLGGTSLLLTSFGGAIAGTVYHAHIKYESGVLHIGYNGAWYESSTRSIDENCTGGFRIGIGKNDNSPTDGNIYCVRVYNRALSASEILQNYNTLKNRFI